MTKTLTHRFTSDEQCPKEAAARTTHLVSFAILTVGLGGLALGISWAWIAFPIGYGFILPLVTARARERMKEEIHDTPPRESTELTLLRDRYVSGEMSDEEFEHGVEQLLATDNTGMNQH